MLDKRLEILMPKDEYEKLQTYSRAAGRSVGSLVREAVKQMYLAPDEEARRRAGERLLADDAAMDWPDWETLKSEIEAGKVSDFDPD